MTIIIDRRFRGPEESGNGGYSAGLLAERMDGDAEVTLRLPPPLDVEMTIRHNGERLTLSHGADLVAEAVPKTVSIDLPPSPGLDAARLASAGFAGFESHFFPTCFSCGPDRTDGLRIFPGPHGPTLVAAAFEPGPDLPAEAGSLTEPIVWAALDCAGAWAEHRMLADTPVVLGRMAAHLEAPVPATGAFVIAAWPMGRDGRKLFSGTALYDASGTPLAWSRQTWIALAAKAG